MQYKRKLQAGGHVQNIAESMAHIGLRGCVGLVAPVAFHNCPRVPSSERLQTVTDTLVGVDISPSRTRLRDVAEGLTWQVSNRSNSLLSSCLLAY